jgi:hypothetical protein
VPRLRPSARLAALDGPPGGFSIARRAGLVVVGLAAVPIGGDVDGSLLTRLARPGPRAVVFVL